MIRVNSFKELQYFVDQFNSGYIDPPDNLVLSFVVSEEVFHLISEEMEGVSAMVKCNAQRIFPGQFSNSFSCELQGLKVIITTTVGGFMDHLVYSSRDRDSWFRNMEKMVRLGKMFSNVGYEKNPDSPLYNTTTEFTIADFKAGIDALKIQDNKKSFQELYQKMKDNPDLIQKSHDWSKPFADFTKRSISELVTKVHKTDTWDNGAPVYICPACFDWLGIDQKYCEECGQKLKWDEDMCYKEVTDTDIEWFKSVKLQAEEESGLLFGRKPIITDHTFMGRKIKVPELIYPEWVRYDSIKEYISIYCKRRNIDFARIEIKYFYDEKMKGFQFKIIEEKSSSWSEFISYDELEHLKKGE
jgi:hypothetical protein